MKRKSTILLLVLAMMTSANLNQSQLAAADEQPTTANTTPATAETPVPSKLPDGLYLVLRSADQEKRVAPVSENETLLANDFHFLEPAEREPVVYLVVQSKPFIPFSLGSDPAEDREEVTGKPRLLLQLSEDQKGPLEEFTRTNLGKTVAIVIGGDVVTSHKVKSAITGGRLQVTRCTEHGCETLFTKLLKNHPKS